jgi:hypothetical protein
VRGDAREGTENVTDQKSLKRRVRARMTKTGERYTAARRNLLKEPPPDVTAAAAAEPATEAASQPAAPPEAAPAGNFRGNRPMSDEILPARTGRAWDEWYGILQAAGATDWPHPEIARWLVTEHSVNGWWAQELTVRFEHAIGRRQPGQRSDGFSATATKTVAVPVERLFDAFVDDATRARWLPADGIRLRTATPYRSARFDWVGGTQRLAIGFESKGEAKSTVSIEHMKLPDGAAVEREKPLWRERLAELKRLLES